MRIAKAGDLVEEDVAATGFGEGETELTVTQLTNNCYFRGQRQGVQSGFALAIDQLKQLAAARYIAGKDDEAALLRSIANSLKLPECWDEKP